MTYLVILLQDIAELGHCQPVGTRAGFSYMSPLEVNLQYFSLHKVIRFTLVLLEVVEVILA